jgi:hypothetical protein
VSCTRCATLEADLHDLQREADTLLAERDEARAIIQAARDLLTAAD